MTCVYLRKFFAPNWLNIMDLSLVTIALISGASEHTGTKEYFQFRMRTMKSKYFENKFDDTRLSSYYENIIGPINFFFLRHDFAKSLPCWLFQFNSNQVEMDEGSSWALVRKKWQLGSPVWRCPWIPAPLHWLWELVTSDKIQRAHYSRATVIGQFLEARLVMELFQRLTHTMNLHWPENRKFLLTYYGHKYVVRSNLRRNCVINP